MAVWRVESHFHKKKILVYSDHQMKTKQRSVIKVLSPHMDYNFSRLRTTKFLTRDLEIRCDNSFSSCENKHQIQKKKISQCKRKSSQPKWNFTIQDFF